MVLSDISIRRPVLAWVLNLVVLLVGIICYTRLPVRLIPNVDVPVVTVATSYPGANAQVIESQITKTVKAPCFHLLLVPPDVFCILSLRRSVDHL